MVVCNLIREFCYRPFVVKVIDFLHIRIPLLWLHYLYYLLVVPKDKKKRVSFNGIDVYFYVHAPLDLRLVEAPFIPGIADERIFLKKLLDELVSGDVAYDIGASIGIHAIFMAKKIGFNGRVIAIEPEDRSYMSLESNINLNVLKNIIPIQIALGNNFSKGILYSQRVAGELTLINSSKNKFCQRVTIVIPDALIYERNLPLPNIVKIDVEGYEYYVIQGFEKSLKRNQCRAVFCEIHPTMLPRAITPDNIVDLLKSYGFNKVDIYPRSKTLQAFCYKTK